MSSESRFEFRDVPGTYVFEGKLARKGYPLNSMCAALNNETDRRQFFEDPESFMDRFQLSDEQKSAVTERDWMRMIELGGNIYYICKIGTSEGLSVQEILAQMTGRSAEEFKEMMRTGGRNPNG